VVAPPAPPQPAPPVDAQGMQGRAAKGASRGTSEPRQCGRDAQAETAERSPAAEMGNAQSERHARMEALLRRRRRGGDGYEESPRNGESQLSSQPPTRTRGAANFAPPEESQGYRGSAAEQPDKGELSSGISMPQPPSAAMSPRVLPGGASVVREARYRVAGSSVSPALGEERPEKRGSAASTPKSTAPPSPSHASQAVVLPHLTPRGVYSSAPPHRDTADAEEKVFRCCHFAGHPVFCCRAEVQRSKGPTRHVVKLERHPGADRLGFGNVAAGPKDAPVLVISWVREGALAAWNDAAPEGLRVPPQSAIVSVNGVVGDVQAMREQLRAQFVEMEVIAPDRWKWGQVVNAG